MDEVEPVEWMLGVLDAAVHVRAAAGAGMPLYGGVGIHDLELVAVLADLHLVARGDRNLREQRPRGLPALGASAHVVEGGLAGDRHFDGIACALAHQRAAAEARRAGLHAVVHGRMN